MRPTALLTTLLLLAISRVFTAPLPGVDPDGSSDSGAAAIAAEVAAAQQAACNAQAGPDPNDPDVVASGDCSLTLAGGYYHFPKE